MSYISAFVKGYDAISTTRKRKEIKKLKNRITMLINNISLKNTTKNYK